MAQSILRSATPLLGYTTYLVETGGEYWYYVMWDLPDSDLQTIIAFRRLAIDDLGLSKLHDYTQREGYIDKLFDVLNMMDTPHFDEYLKQFVSNFPTRT